MRRTYGEARYDPDRRHWVIERCEPHVALRLKKIFPRISTSSVAPFRLYDSPDTCADLDWFLDRYPLAMSAPDKDRMKTHRALFEREQAEVEKLLLPGRIPVHSGSGLKPGCALRDYQVVMTELTERVKRVLICDGVGLGKSYEGIGVALKPKNQPAAIVVQAHLPSQWQEKIEEFSYLSVHAIRRTTPYDLPPAQVYIFKYSQLAGWVDVFREGFFRTAIFDEVQELRTGRAAQKGQGARVLADNAETVVGLTATPIYNWAVEVFNIAEIIKPGLLGTREEFLREWCAGDDRVVADPAALGTYLRECHFMLRRTRSDVGKEMARASTIVESVGYDDKAVAQAGEIAAALAMKSLRGSFVERGQAARELDMFAREMTGISKARYVAQFVRMLLEAGEPVLLSGWHRAVYEIWNEELKTFKPVMYTGTETPSQKDAAKQAFMDGTTDLMIISNRSGAGLDGLQYRCNTAVIGELDWSPKVHEQVIGRLDREGQNTPVMGIFLVSEFGSDPVIVDLLGLKNSQAAAIVDPGHEVVVVNSDSSRLKKLAESFLSKRQRKDLERPREPVRVAEQCQMAL